MPSPRPPRHPSRANQNLFGEVWLSVRLTELSQGINPGVRRTLRIDGDVHEGKKRLPKSPSISRCCDIDSRRDHQLRQFEESML